MDTVAAFYDIVGLIDNDRAMEARSLRRAIEELNRRKDVDPDVDGKVPDLDNNTLGAARYMATTYDRWASF